MTSPVAPPGPQVRGHRRPRRPVLVRLVLLSGGGLALIAGLDGALLLLGVGAPVSAERLAAVHGVLMVLGFIGTVVGLERAVALGRRWGFAAPALTGLAGIALISPLPLSAAGALLVAGTAVQAAIFVPLWRRRRDAPVLVQALGAASALGAAILFTGGAEPAAYLGWLIGFVVLVIAGERMELARVAGSDARWEQAAQGCAVLMLAAIVVAVLFPTWGGPLLGATLLLMVGVLVRVDVARRMLRSEGLPRFSAVCLLAGYCWLALAGAILLISADPLAGGGFDAVVHAVFLGFAMSMIFAHAPVILPAVLRRPLPYHPAMYLPAALLHGALLLRIAVGDLRNERLAWQIGGVGNVVAVISFVLTAATVAVLARRGRRPRVPGGEALGNGQPGMTEKAARPPVPTHTSRASSTVTARRARADTEPADSVTATASRQANP